MNLKIVGYLISVLVIMEGLAVAFCAGVSALMGDPGRIQISMLLCALVTAAIGTAGAFLLDAKSSSGMQMGIREGFAVVAGGWLAASFFGAFPFVLTAGFHWYDAFFETVSGFSTTGSTIIGGSLRLRSGFAPLPNGIESLPYGILFWRALTHWIGGMGIVVLSLAILPMLGIGGQALFNAEVPGVKTHEDQLTPRIAGTAKILFMVYFILTLMETLLLWAGGMELFDAVCHSFSTIATGGFSTKNESIAAYDSSYIQLVIVLFMFLAGCNFILHYRALRGLPWKQYLSEEYRFFACTLGVVTLIITLTLLFSKTADPLSGETYYMSPWLALRSALFQSVALATTTGFSTADYTVWPGACGILLLGLLLMGACGGSTSGGMKCVRVMLCFKFSFSELRRCIFPRSLQDIRLDGKRVETPVLNKALGFLVIYIMTVFLFAILLPLVCRMDILTALTASASCLSNAGPGFGRIGPMDSFSWMNPAAKLLLALEMLIGRLELYTILVIFLPSFWKK